MDIVGIVLGSIALIIYVGSVVRSSPRLVVRLANAENLHVRLGFPKGDWALSVSTTRKKPVLIRSCLIYHEVDELQLKSDLFKPIPRKKRLAFEWSGEEQVEDSLFLMLPLDYECNAPFANRIIYVSFVSTIPADD